MSKQSLVERKEYLKNRVNPILEVMVADLMKERPESVLTYMGHWISKKGEKVQAEVNKKNTQNLEGMESSEESEEEEYVPSPQPKKKGARTSVSSESFGRFNKKEAFVAKVIPKSQSAIDRIKKRLGQSFMFNALDEKEQEGVVGAMEEHHFKSGEYVIKQGDDGDVLYVVDEGNLDCEKLFPGNDKPTFLKTYIPGEAFGELALLYNAPRAASIYAKDNSTCFSLDRATFNNIVKDSAIAKRQVYENFLDKVEILNTLDGYEKGKIADCLKTEKFKKGDYVIKEGESGNTFFFIQTGTAIALKKQSDGSDKVVYSYSENEYFGELALLRDEPRAASIQATNDLIVAWIDRLSFKRLLGSLDKILERNSDKYAKFVQQS